MEIRLLPAGGRVAGFWLGLAGAALGGLLALFALATALVFWGLWGALCLWFVWGWCPTARLCRRGEALVFEAGRFFPLTVCLPLPTVSGFASVSSPLMRQAGCCLLLVFSSSGLALALPGVAQKDADALERLLRED